MACGTETLADDLFTGLLAGEDFTFPVIDISGDEFNIPVSAGTTVEPLTNESLTTRVVGGSGTFDAVAASYAAHLKEEYKQGRITGAEYAKAFTALLESALGNSVQYLLQRNQAALQAELLKVQIVTARLEAATAKAKLAQTIIEAKTLAASFALTKLKLATEEVTHCTAKYNLDIILPKQSALLTSQIGSTNAESALKLKQRELIAEQVETQRAQTLDTRTDGTLVAGSVGKEKELHSQQIESFQRDSEVKAARIFTEAWITSKTIDEGLLPPDSFANPSLEGILVKLKLNNGFT